MKVTHVFIQEFHSISFKIVRFEGWCKALRACGYLWCHGTICSWLCIVSFLYSKRILQITFQKIMQIIFQQNSTHTTNQQHSPPTIVGHQTCNIIQSQRPDSKIDTWLCYQAYLYCTIWGTRHPNLPYSSCWSYTTTTFHPFQYHLFPSPLPRKEAD